MPACWSSSSAGTEPSNKEIVSRQPPPAKQACVYQPVQDQTPSQRNPRGTRIILLSFFLWFYPSFLTRFSFSRGLTRDDVNAESLAAHGVINQITRSHSYSHTNNNTAWIHTAMWSTHSSRIPTTNHVLTRDRGGQSAGGIAVGGGRGEERQILPGDLTRADSSA